MPDARYQKRLGALERFGESLLNLWNRVRRPTTGRTATRSPAPGYEEGSGYWERDGHRWYGDSAKVPGPGEGLRQMALVAAALCRDGIIADNVRLTRDNQGFVGVEGGRPILDRGLLTKLVDHLNKNPVEDVGDLAFRRDEKGDLAIKVPRVRGLRAPRQSGEEAPVGWGSVAGVAASTSPRVPAEARGVQAASPIKEQPKQNNTTRRAR